MKLAHSYSQLAIGTMKHAHVHVNVCTDRLDIYMYMYKYMYIVHAVTCTVINMSYCVVQTVHVHLHYNKLLYYYVCIMTCTHVHVHTIYVIPPNQMAYGIVVMCIEPTETTNRLQIFVNSSEALVQCRACKAKLHTQLNVGHNRQPCMHTCTNKYTPHSNVVYSMPHMQQEHIHKSHTCTCTYTTASHVLSIRLSVIIYYLFVLCAGLRYMYIGRVCESGITHPYCPLNRYTHVLQQPGGGGAGIHTTTPPSSQNSQSIISKVY